MATNFERWKAGLTPENCQTFMLEVLQHVFPDFKLTIPKEANEKFLDWANAKAEVKMTDDERSINYIKGRVEIAVEQILEAEGYLRRKMPGCAVSRLLMAGKIATQCGEQLEKIVLKRMKETTNEIV